MSETANGAMEEFHAEMEQANLQPLWDRYDNLLVEEPAAQDPPMLWRWADLQPFIDRAARDVSMDQAERRVLMLVNPAFEGKVVTTTNLFAGMQILEPGEQARPHRHTPSAMRFIVEGKGGATIVNGQRCEMLTGDLILTPNWAWHEHLNDGDERVVWLDALDLPLAANLGTIFSQRGNPNAYDDDVSAMPDASFAVGGVVPDVDTAHPSYSPMFRYAWEDTLKSLAATPSGPDGSRRVRYTNPVDGSPAVPTMDCFAMQLAKGRATKTRRSTCNAVFICVDGEGESTIGDTTLKWREHDVFTVPHWNWTSHKALSETARLFTFTDREVLRRLHFLRDEEQG